MQQTTTFPFGESTDGMDASLPVGRLQYIKHAEDGPTFTVKNAVLVSLRVFSLTKNPQREQESITRSLHVQ